MTKAEHLSERGVKETLVSTENQDGHRDNGGKYWASPTLTPNWDQLGIRRTFSPLQGGKQEDPRTLNKSLDTYSPHSWGPQLPWQALNSA